MNRMVEYRNLLLHGAIIACVLPLLTGCVNPQQTEQRTDQLEDEAMRHDQEIAPGIAVTSDIRRNLGITFAIVERRKVEDLLRIPGEFESLPSARHEYRAPLSGHIDIAVAQFDRVEADQLLFTLDSPDWRRVQHEAVEAEGEIKLAAATLNVATSSLEEAKSAFEITQKRLEGLASASVRNAELEAEAAALEASLNRLQAEIEAAKAKSEEAEEHYLSRLRTLASITTLPIPELLEPTADGTPRWRTIDALGVRAEEAAVVETVAVNEGGWRETGELVLTTLDPTALRFHADAPQSELTRLRDGMRCRIVPPQGGGVGIQDAIEGTLNVGLTAHAADRTVSIYVTPEQRRSWTKAGVAGFLEVPREEAEAALAIPAASLVQDGLDTIFYRRLPDNPNRVVPVKADLGPSDGKWTVVWSGVKEGDEVVLDGAYALKLASGSQQSSAGFHVHADGSVHENH